MTRASFCKMHDIVLVINDGVNSWPKAWRLVSIQDYCRKPQKSFIVKCMLFTMKKTEQAVRDTNRLQLQKSWRQNTSKHKSLPLQQFKLNQNNDNDNNQKANKKWNIHKQQSVSLHSHCKTKSVAMLTRSWCWSWGTQKRRHQPLQTIGNREWFSRHVSRANEALIVVVALLFVPPHWMITMSLLTRMAQFHDDYSRFLLS